MNVGPILEQAVGQTSKQVPDCVHEVFARNVAG